MTGQEATLFVMSAALEIANTSSTIEEFWIGLASFVEANNASISEHSEAVDKFCQEREMVIYLDHPTLETAREELAKVVDFIYRKEAEDVVEYACTVDDEETSMLRATLIKSDEQLCALLNSF